MLCARCHSQNPDAARFCNQCGAPIAAAAAPEFKRLTVMFCDLVGSVELSSQLDPEDWHLLLAAYQAAAGTVIRKHHGHIAQHLGDGLVVYFGYPLAGEDDALRAVQAALEVVAAVSIIPVPHSQARLRVRVGLHTGPTVMGHVGSGSEGEYLALGETPNIAARIQAQAPANGVLISPATRTLVASRVRCVEVGDFALKGLPAPMRLYQALALRQDGADGERRAHISPFLGRHEEMRLLAQCWAEAGSGRGKCVLVLGEPGIGKSRLAKEMRARTLRGEADAWLMRCSAHATNTPFAPVIHFLQQAMALVDAAGGPAEALGTALGAVGVTDESVAAPLRAMMGIEAADPGAAAMSAQALRERTFGAVTAVATTIAARRRTLLILEDLHWSDPTTLEWLGRFLRRDLPPGLMLLLLARTEFDPPWARGPAVERIELEPCNVHDAQAIISSLDDAGSLGGASRAHIVERAEGNPLFVEEFTRAALESQGDEIPLTLQEQTMARLDRLGSAKHALQQAAVIGRHFSRRQLHAVSGLDEPTLAAALQRGVESHMLRQPPEGGSDVFAFHHALLRDAAYSSLLRSARQSAHARVAQVLLAQDAAVAERQPELLAHHFTEAGQVPAAIAHWLRAARMSLARSACVEAAAHARKALGLLGDPGESPQGLAQELELRLVLAPALMAVRGVLDPEVEQVYARARELSRRLGSGPKMLVPLWGLWAYELMRGELQRAQDVTLQLRELAEGSAQPLASLVAAMSAGMTYFYRGDLVAARDQCARGVGQFQVPGSDRSARGVHNPGVMCHAFHSLSCFLLGEREKAEAGAAALLAAVPGLLPYDVAYAWCFDAVLHTLDGNAAKARESAAKAIAISREQAFPAWLMMGSMIEGWGRARQGEALSALEHMRRSFQAWCASGARNLRPFFLALLADASLAGGLHEQAAAFAVQGLAEAEVSESCWNPELHRLHAEALGHLGRHDAAVQSARLALSTAQAMGAQPWAGTAQEVLQRLQPDKEAPA